VIEGPEEISNPKCHVLGALCIWLDEEEDDEERLHRDQAATLSVGN
jgi:hypothetical protein